MYICTAVMLFLHLFIQQWIFLLSYSLSYFFFFLFSSALLSQWTEKEAEFIIAAVSDYRAYMHVHTGTIHSQEYIQKWNYANLEQNMHLDKIADCLTPLRKLNLVSCDPKFWAVFFKSHAMSNDCNMKYHKF